MSGSYNVEEVKQVYLVVGYYSDKSGCMLFGSFSMPDAANDRADLLRAANSPYTVKVLQSTIGRSEPQEIF